MIDKDLSCFIMKSLVIAKEMCWDISIKDFNFNPDFSNLEKYESKMFLQYLDYRESKEDL